MCSRSRESPSSRLTPGANVTRCRRCCLGLESTGTGGSRRGFPTGTPGTGAAAACIPLASSVRRLPASICFESAPSSVCIRHRQSNCDASTARKSSSRLPPNRPPPPYSSGKKPCTLSRLREDLIRCDGNDDEASSEHRVRTEELVSRSQQRACTHTCTQYVCMHVRCIRRAHGLGQARQGAVGNDNN